ncbi:hypothetical protein L3Q82_012760 [Scortum barcoo]|uniref:Uncharacterized protein n=1 Tax=Scortum barcoo TaxID=214431 RepID=A0ACB8W386_9TELE|nr:hypothetical protein L3Q82_012760 [Scortum barcoo]
MPQLTGAGGDDLGASDELIPFKDEGEAEEKRTVSAGRDLDDVKSSLVNESETNSSSDSEADRRPRPDPDVESRARQSQLFEEVMRRRQDGGLFQPSPYVGYPFFMIPDLGNLCSPYLANGALTPSARTYLPFQWPLLDVPGRAGIRDSATPTHLSNSVPVVQHPHMTHLHPLLSYSPETFSPQRASPGFSPDAGEQLHLHTDTNVTRNKTGMSRTPHGACYPASPGGMAQIPHPLGWLQGQPMYPIAGGFSPAALAMNASMSSLVSNSFSPRLVPTPQAPNPAIVKQEPGGSSQPGKSMADAPPEKEDEKKPHIKKPLNAFMLYMREERPKVVAQCKVKESATINQILGQRWHSLSKDEQAKYYELARKERLLHSKLYPGWSARDNYGKKKKRKRTKSDSQPEVKICTRKGKLINPSSTVTREEDIKKELHLFSCRRLPPTAEKASRAAGGDASHALAQTAPPPPDAASHTVSHLTHFSHLSQASPASSLDSPATPTAALASPTPPRPRRTLPKAYTHSSYGGQMSPSRLSSCSRCRSPPNPTGLPTL